MKISQAVAFSVCLAVAQAAIANAGLRSGSRAAPAPLAADASVSTVPKMSPVDDATRKEADKLMHFLVQDANDAEKKAEEAEKNSTAAEKAEKANKKAKEAPRGSKAPTGKTDEEVEEEITYKQFMVACLVHTAEVIQRIDGSYTDSHLQTVLENECHLSKEFPLTKKSGFDNHEDCMAFAKDLTRARHEELDDGTTEGYKAFCKDFYETQILTKEVEKEKEAETELEKEEGVVLTMGGRGVWLILGCLALCLCGIMAVIFGKKKEKSNTPR
jgi:hypothetical protein